MNTSAAGLTIDTAARGTDPLDGFASPDARRKRLGQYFTGDRLARLLAALADAPTADQICDPMAGQGDMFAACLSVGARPSQLHGVEIDPKAHAQAAHRLGAVPSTGDFRVVRADAFSGVWADELSLEGYGLVITNPPYVRYQSGSSTAGVDTLLPSADQVRQGLVETLKNVKTLSECDRELFLALAGGYSGLADLAVPSWLLAAALVRPGGQLAVVVPESWLSRDYAAPIQYLLLRLFDIQYLVEDVHACWFDDALVKTTLLVAKRVESRNDTLTPPADRGFVHIRLGRDSVDSRSIVGALYPKSPTPDLDFARDAAKWLEVGGSAKEPGLFHAWTPAIGLASNVTANARAQNWLRQVEDSVPSREVAVPQPLLRLISTHTSGSKPALVDIEGLGWVIGQGLRTGANDFFYATSASDYPGALRSSRPLGSRLFVAPPEVVLPVLRKQTELPKTHKLRPNALPGRVLVLDGWALPEDIAASSRVSADMAATVREHLAPVNRELATLIRVAARKKVGVGPAARRIPQLSAVRPNVRSADASKSSQPPRFWYMLPPFKARHLPDLVIARVQGSRIRAFSNPNRELVVDANFSTLWATTPAAMAPAAMLALLNSAWVGAVLELTASVMGGGALKVEATHLRRVPLPVLDSASIARFEVLGEALASAEVSEVPDILMKIDSALASVLVGETGALAFAEALRDLVTERLAERTR